MPDYVEFPPEGDYSSGANQNHNNAYYPIEYSAQATTRVLTDEKGHSIKIRIASPPPQRHQVARQQQQYQQQQQQHRESVISLGQGSDSPLMSGCRRASSQLSSDDQFPSTEVQSADRGGHGGVFRSPEPIKRMNRFVTPRSSGGSTSGGGGDNALVEEKEDQSGGGVDSDRSNSKQTVAEQQHYINNNIRDNKCNQVSIKSGEIRSSEQETTAASRWVEFDLDQAQQQREGNNEMRQAEEVAEVAEGGSGRMGKSNLVVFHDGQPRSLQLELTRTGCRAAAVATKRRRLSQADSHERQHRLASQRMYVLT